MMFIKNSANSHGWVNPRDVEAIWMDHFDYYYREFDEFIFPMTIHPGRIATQQQRRLKLIGYRREWKTACLAYARAHHRAHQQARGRRVGDYGRDV